jgi:hypothetical protein
MNTKSDFIVKINDSHCEWEFGFNAYDKSIQNFVDAITDKLGIKCNYQKLIVSNEELKANKDVNISFDYGKIEHDPLDDLPIIGDGVLMEVSFMGNRWVERYVFGKSDLGFLAWHENKSDISLWKYARPITKTKITRKEFEQKFVIID